MLKQILNLLSYNPISGKPRRIRSENLFHRDGDGNVMLKSQPYNFIPANGIFRLDGSNNVMIGAVDIEDDIWERDIDGNVMLKAIP